MNGSTLIVYQTVKCIDFFPCDPADALSSHGAIVLLEDCGFRIVSDWIPLSRRLGVPTEIRIEASQRSSRAAEALEECIDWFIKNNESASWPMFIHATGKVNVNAAKQLKKRLEQEGTSGL